MSILKSAETISEKYNLRPVEGDKRPPQVLSYAFALSTSGKWHPADRRLFDVAGELAILDDQDGLPLALYVALVIELGCARQACVTDRRQHFVESL